MTIDTKDPYFAKDVSIVSTVAKAGPLLLNPNGDYVAPTVPVLHYPAGQIKCCVRKGYLETFEEGGNQFVRVSKKGQGWLQEIRKMQEEAGGRVDWLPLEPE